MVIKEEYLVKRNNKNRIQIAIVQMDQHPYTGVFTIYRQIFQYKGKHRYIPNIYITGPRYGMTQEKYAALLFEKSRKKYLSIGYCPLSKLTNKPLDKLTEKDLLGLIVKKNKEFEDSLPLPMVPKSYDQCSPTVLEKPCYCVQSVDGIRCYMYKQDNNVVIRSVDQKYYNISSIVHDPVLVALFTTLPELILDGFLYKHGWSLSRIQNACDTLNEDSNKIQFWLFDYISNEAFSKRYEQLKEFQELFDGNTDKVIIPEQLKLEGWLKIKKAYDGWVKQGFDGLIVRFPERPYGVGKKSAFFMILIKQYRENSFEITDILQTGFTVSDLQITLMTNAGIRFKVQVYADVDVLQDLLDNKDNYIGKLAKCTYSYISTEGLPVNPSFKCLN